MPEPASPTRAELADLIRGRETVRAAGHAEPVERVTWTRSPSPAAWLVDGDVESSIGAHAAAHRADVPSEAAVAYGAGVDPETVAERLLALAELSRRHGLLRAVCPVPAEGDSRRPGSWGVEDLAVIAAARLCMPEVPWIRPHWRRLGAGACQVAVAFGATDWVLPEDERADPVHLAAAVGRVAVAR
jgi:hypothetical protein